MKNDRFTFKSQYTMRGNIAPAIYDFDFIGMGAKALFPLNRRDLRREGFEYFDFASTIECCKD